MDIRIQRSGSRKKVEAYKSGELETSHILQHLPSTLKPTWILDHRYIHQWSRKKAVAQWGKPDGCFRGEWFYRLFFLTAVTGEGETRKTQDFLLISDPDGSGKGSGVELIEPIHPEMVVPLLEHLHRSHPNCPT